MKVSLRWLREYVPITLPPEELADKLTQAGTEVTEITTVGESWDNVFVGLVTKVDKHPNADRLVLATVELPDEEHTVVCGAPNVAAGQKIAFAKIGAELIDGHTGKPATLKAAKIRGVVSAGMVCSEKELGLSDEHEGILVLPEEAPLGVPLPEFMGDQIFDLELTPNRPDCQSMLGIAWEVGALTGNKVSLPEVEYPEQDPPIDEVIKIEVADPDLCARYTASLVTGMTVAPSPQWMQERLIAAGMRPINNIVDVTNYVMLEYGQPLHAFDYDKLREKHIIVRRARPGERLVSLDGEDRELDAEMLAITDPQGPVGLAGVMGGANTEVSEGTTAVLLESANFNNVNIRRTSDRLKLRSEASIRFDKGLSPELPIQGLRRATQLLAEVGGGTVTRGVIDVYPGKLEPEPVAVTPGRVEQVLGISVEKGKIISILESLGFECTEGRNEEVSVEVPFWRSDITIEDDLVEEVARIIGYDQIPVTPLSGQIPHRESDPLRQLGQDIRDILTTLGMQEVINYSLIGLAGMKEAGIEIPDTPRPLKVSNPMRSDQEYLRLSLRPGLLGNVAQNERRQEEGLCLFEVGRIYPPREKELPAESQVLAAIVTGPKKNAEEGFLRAKGILETLLNELGVEARFEADSDPGLYSGRVVALKAENDQLGVLGEVHPSVSEAFDIDSPAVHIFELDLQTLLRHVPSSKSYRPVSRFPGALRDVALIVDGDTPARAVEDLLKSFPIVTSVKLFDIYTGDQVPAGKKSLAYTLMYQSPNRTLTEDEVNVVQAQLLQRLNKELGAELRGG